jgi:hypothetical protein
MSVISLLLEAVEAVKVIILLVPAVLVDIVTLLVVLLQPKKQVVAVMLKVFYHLDLVIRP